MEAPFRNLQELRVAVPLFLLFLWRVSGGICPPGPHRLRYDLTAFSQEESGQPQFRAVGFLDDELFLHYDWNSSKAEPCGPRSKSPAGPETWARETERLQEEEEQLRRMLAEVTGQKGQDGGFHTLQATFGCELQGNSTKGFWLLGYNGQDLLSFDQKTLRWTMAGPSAQQIKMFWETHGPTADLVKTFLDDICPAQLKRHLASLNILPDIGPPMVKVTHRKDLVGRIILTCRAFHLYPPVATLTWLQDGEPVQQNTFQPGTIRPSGEGTYQTWASIWVLPGQEAQFTCHLSHCSHNITVPAVSGYEARKTDGVTSSASVLKFDLSIMLVLVLVLVLVFPRRY